MLLVHGRRTLQDGLAGFTCCMNERDKEWLDKNNEEEGTSILGAVSASATRRTTEGHGVPLRLAPPVSVLS